MLKDAEQETTPVREIHQEQDRVQYHASREIDHSAPLFGQPAVHQKMRAFHSAMAATRFHRCGTCLENFLCVSSHWGAQVNVARKCLQSSPMINNYTLVHVMVVKIQNQWLHVIMLLAQAHPTYAMHTTSIQSNDSCSLGTSIWHIVEKWATTEG